MSSLTVARTIILFCLLAVTGIASGDQFDTLIMPGKLIAGHEEFETQCEKCHVLFDQSKQDGLCLDCHDKIDGDMKQKKGYHGLHTLVANVECRSCHTDHKGRNFDILLLDNETFDHDLSDYPLTGAHQKVVCSDCHESDKLYRDVSSDCYACHKQDDQHKGELGRECADCHDDRSWVKAEFDHDDTKFPLREAHKDVVCAGCHPDERYKKLPVDCNACHKLNDVHAGSYGESCDDCHNEHKWSEIQFDHDRDTDYPLVGGHRKTSCASCHQQDVHRSLDRACIACHKNDDVHRGRYGKQCNDCHTLNNWADDAFDHDKDTDYPLRGKHAAVACEACHRGDVHMELSSQCNSCHRGDDVHQGEQGQKCDQCHNEKSWNHNVVFNHDFSRFPLIGMHSTTSCEECHFTREYKKAPMDCIACHEKDDVHKDKLGSECEQCHNPNHWRTWLFDHDKQTDYPLEGAHRNLDCLSCHTDPLGKNEIVPPTDCNSCHSDDDIHFGKFGKYCNRCHGFDSFDLEESRQENSSGADTQSPEKALTDKKTTSLNFSKPRLINYLFNLSPGSLNIGIHHRTNTHSYKSGHENSQ